MTGSASTDKRRELLAAATPRPWATDVPRKVISTPTGEGSFPEIPIRHVVNEDGWVASPRTDDAALIVAAVNDYERLLDIAEAAEGYREEFAKRGVQTAESMAAWDRMNVALAAFRDPETDQ